MVLDGHNRWVACERLGIPPKSEDFNGGNPWNYVWSLNGQRRDLVEEQRYLIWKHCEENGADFQAQRQSIKEEANQKRSEAAKERDRKSDATLAPDPVVVQNEPPLDEPPKEQAKRTTGKHKGREINVRAANVNSTTVKRGDVLANEWPDLASKVGLREKKS